MFLIINHAPGATSVHNHYNARKDYLLFYGKYYITMFYYNEYNRANGQDL